eukprot:557528-Rhodomonas_salina.6
MSSTGSRVHATAVQRDATECVLGTCCATRGPDTRAGVCAAMFQHENAAALGRQLDRRGGAAHRRRQQQKHQEEGSQGQQRRQH